MTSFPPSFVTKKAKHIPYQPEEPFWMVNVAYREVEFCKPTYVVYISDDRIWLWFGSVLMWFPIYIVNEFQISLVIVI